jgi:ADP-dependent NAD(P)H-hydrate dehydratase / NAD(P)H-hydrate epimerase
VLRGRGAHARVVGPGDAPAIGQVDLVIDAAYGTGFRGSYDAPTVPPGTDVLAVDIP